MAFHTYILRSLSTGTSYTALGKLRPNQLELVSTLHFIASRQKQIHKSFSEKSVLSEFKAVKGDKFRDRDVKECYKSLASTGLV